MLKLNWETGASHKLPGHSTSYPEPSTSYRNIPQANGTFHKRPEQSTSYRKIPRATATFKFGFSKFVFGTCFSNYVFGTRFFNICFKHSFRNFFRTQFAEIWILVFKMCPWHHDTQEVHVLFFLLRFAIPAEAICRGRSMAASRNFFKVGEVILPHFRFLF